MVAYKEMLVQPALKAGMKVPPDLEKFDKTEYPHWYVFMVMQLGTPMPYAGVLWDNAAVIASIDEVSIKTLSVFEIRERGFQ